MIVKKDFLNKLKDLGLNSYEAKLWTSLLSRGISSAGELSDIANVPRSRTYDVLESLEKKGFIIMKLGKPIKYIAVPPEEVIDRVKKRIIVDADSQANLLEKFKKSEVINDLNMLHSQGIDLVEPSDLSGAIKGRKNFYNHLESMINDSKESIIIMTGESGLLKKADVLLKPLKKAKERGVDIKISSPISVKNTDKLKELSSIAQVRHSKNVKGRFMIFDKKNVVFTLVDGEEAHPSFDNSIWVNTPFFAQTMNKMFDSVWTEMTPLHKVK